MLAIVVSACLIACNSGGSETVKTDSLATNGSSSTIEKNKATALASMQAFVSQNVDEVMKNAATDIVDYGDGSMPPIKSKDSVKSMMKQWFAAFPDYKGENMMTLADSNHVAVFADWSGTFKGPLMGMKPTGKSFKVKDVDLFTFDKDGKITEHRSIQSSVSIMSQVGGPMK